MAGFFSRKRHGRRFYAADRFDQALSIAHRWFLDQVGEVATIQYVTAPADLDWWQQDAAPPLVTSGITETGTVVLTLYRKFIVFRYGNLSLLPEVLYELLLTEWATLTGCSLSDLDPEL